MYNTIARPLQLDVVCCRSVGKLQRLSGRLKQLAADSQSGIAEFTMGKKSLKAYLLFRFVLGFTEDGVLCLLNRAFRHRAAVVVLDQVAK